MKWLTGAHRRLLRRVAANRDYVVDRDESTLVHGLLTRDYIVKRGPNTYAPTPAGEEYLREYDLAVLDECIAKAKSP